ncbi:SMI1/KNR4 family protein [Streptomyces noursei]|uniref:SMI1/KNR4 family protein n=1 Tax=Streptomyces noursei TaxID=1971 RepID=UPI000C9BE34C|nr:SMI1/KNR4 family protein [Streptomyces noursei]
MTTGIKAVVEFIGLVRAHEDIAHHADDCTPEMIREAEEALGLTFPPSYRRFVEELGTCDIGGTEFLGVYRTELGVDRLWGSSYETIDARNQWGMPHALIAVEYDGMGGTIVLDSSQPSVDGEYPVLVWEAGAEARGPMESLAPDFGSYALDVGRRAVQAAQSSP